MYTPKVNKFSWYDTETTGINTKLDQILQAAIVETDADLNIIEGSAQNIMCKPRLDVVPHPKAYLTHFLDVDELNGNGMNEFMLTRKLLNSFTATDNIAISGYNTNRYDNELVRNLAFRNMKDPYSHEWRNGNIKFDSFKLVQMVYAFRPEILKWRKKADGKTSLKLADLSVDNGIEHINAHDALDDVYATIALTKLIKTANPRLFSHALKMTQKANVIELIGAHRAKDQPLIHIDPVYGQENSIGTLIYPVAMDKSIKDKYLFLDLRHDPSILLDMSPADIRKHMYTKRDELPEGAPQMPIVSITANKQPNIVSPDGLINSFADKAMLNLSQCERHIQFIKDNKSALMTKVQEAMEGDMPPSADVYTSIYSGGFISKQDASKRADMHLKDSPNLNDDSFKIEKQSTHKMAMGMQDSIRQQELLLRAKWNSFYESLLSDPDGFSPTEFRSWVDYVEHKLYEGIEGSLTIPEFRSEVAKVELEMPLDEHARTILDKLINHVESLEVTVGAFRELADELIDSAKEELSNSVDIKEYNAKVQQAYNNAMQELGGFGAEIFGTEEELGLF